MGIRHAKSVAYLRRCNGRSEVAGRQLFEKLRKIHIMKPRRNWFEEMWPALKAHHDTPTPSGLSPHEILFGRDPLGRGLPLSGDGMAMDAKEFFARQEATARDIRQQLEKEHAEYQESGPSSTAQKVRVGDPVWVIRPRPMGTHRTKTWFTPREVVRRIGEDTYRIKVGHGQFWERHGSQLCLREPDLRGQRVSLDYAAHEADSDDDYAEQDDSTVDKILVKHPNASAPGGLEFKVRWRGYGPSHDTWEPVCLFVVVCLLGTRLHSCASLFLKIRNPKSQSTNLAGSLDGAPIITQSRRHKPCSKTEVSYSAHSQLAFDASLLFTDCQRDCDCDLRFARCCAALLRCCCSKP